jgi:hypothetical protein
MLYFLSILTTREKQGERQKDKGEKIVPPPIWQNLSAGGQTKTAGGRSFPKNKNGWEGAF